MKILIALDGSPHAHAALDYAAAFPFAAPPDVELVNVCPVADLHGLRSGVSADVNLLVDECRSHNEELLKTAAQSCRSWAKSVHTKLLDGHAAKEIVRAAGESGADLIVVGARGMSGVRRFLLGSVSEGVAAHAPCSVLVVRSEGGRIATPPAGRILIADDGSLSATSAITCFAGLPLGDRRDVLVLAVMETLEHFGLAQKLESEPTWQAEVKFLHDHAEKSAERLRSATPGVRAVCQKAGDVASEIVHIAESTRRDLIVMGHAGKSGWEKLVLGSVSRRVLTHAHCSIWIHRARPA